MLEELFSSEGVSTVGFLVGAGAVVVFTGAVDGDASGDALGDAEVVGDGDGFLPGCVPSQCDLGCVPSTK